MEILYENINKIHNMIYSLKLTHEEISMQLRDELGIEKGLSARNIRKFCQEVGFKQKGIITGEMLSQEVKTAIAEVGPTYGRKMMKGYLSTKGVKASEARVRQALQEANGPYQRERQRVVLFKCTIISTDYKYLINLVHYFQKGARNLNPIPYSADGFGHKLHLDQNEKLVMFGVTHVIAIDGWSGKIVGFTSMPIKNNFTIYDRVFRHCVLQWGMFSQVRVDHGKEFYMCLFMQEINAAQRTRQDIPPYVQSVSTQNHRVERIWVEVNNRLNYPLKSALVEMVDEGTLDMDDNITRFCTSEFCLRLCEIGLKRVVNSWNQHPVPGRGVPNDLALNKRGAAVNDDMFPSSVQVSALYNQRVGSTLKKPTEFARDPFLSDQGRLACENYFHCDIENILNCCSNNDYVPLKENLLNLIRITQRHCVN